MPKQVVVSLVTWYSKEIEHGFLGTFALCRVGQHWWSTVLAKKVVWKIKQTHWFRALDDGRKPYCILATSSVLCKIERTNSLLTFFSFLVPIDLDVKVKATMLGAVFLIVSLSKYSKDCLDPSDIDMDVRKKRERFESPLATYVRVLHILIEKESLVNTVSELTFQRNHQCENLLLCSSTHFV